jgi:hypothetical protein
VHNRRLRRGCYIALVSSADLTSERWRALDQTAAEALTEAVARAVGGESLGVRWPRSHAPALRVARIVVDGTEFVLVPGGQARLGFDADRYEPTDAEVRSFFGDHTALRSWRDSPPERPARADPLPGQLGLFDTPAPARRRRPSGDAATVRAHVAARVTSPRTVVVPALLVAADAVQAGTAEDTQGCRCAAGPAGYDDVVTGLATAGRRLLTPDEWEYACGLGRGTLFSWGDRMPAPRDGETPTGLRLGDMYWPELTSVRTEVRGGDFGVLGCGGETEFHHSLLRSPAFRDPQIVAAEAGVPDVRHRRFRAAMDVPTASGGQASR